MRQVKGECVASKELDSTHTLAPCFHLQRRGGAEAVHRSLAHTRSPGISQAHPVSSSTPEQTWLHPTV